MARKNKGKGKQRKPKRRAPRQTVARSPDGLKKRLDRKRPIAAPAEPPEDVAVFDATVRSTLPSEVADQAKSVSESLRLVSESHDADALERIREIPRRSPLSEWRLFIRGLVDWYARRIDAAAESWSRLDDSRRPARIAATLQASLREDLGAADGPAHTSAAKLVRTLRIERPAIREAAAKLTHLREPKDLTISDVTIAWLKPFVNEYRSVEPDFIRAIEAAALHRASAQPYVDLFAMATRTFRGPDHDPSSTLRQSHYERKFEGGDDKADRLRNFYLTDGLPNYDRISPAVRNAMISHLYLEEALDEIVPPSPGGFLGALMAFIPDEDSKRVEQCFQKAIKAYPAHRKAHRELVDWVKLHAENERAKKAERERFAKKLPAIMVNWSQSLPDDIEPRLWLVDHLLENEQLDDAKPHVEWLSASRHEDPRVRATPWKWQVLEAMRLCRRKSWLAQVPQHLDAAESLWPDWLSRDWLPYLRAAYSLRRGDEDAYQTQRQAIREAAAARGNASAADGPPPTRGPLTDAVMMLAAAQRMRIPAAELKVIRQPVDQAVANLKSVTLDDLLAAGVFFWDLHRTSLLYPAYRMHGSKLGRELVTRINAVRKFPKGSAESAVLWMSQHQFWPTNHGSGLPRFLNRWSSDSPYVAAAMVQAILLARYGDRELGQMKDKIEFVRESAKTVPDRFYRYWFEQLAEQAEQAIQCSKRPSGMFPDLDQFAEMVDRFRGGFEDEWDDDDEEDEGAYGWYPEEPDAEEEHDFFQANDPGDDHPIPTARLDAFGQPQPVPKPRGAEIPRDPEARRHRPKNPLDKKKGRRR